MNANVFSKASAEEKRGKTINEDALHPAWRKFLRYCLELRHGEIERLKIQDGLPVIAEVTRHKIKFSP